jgi:hypothetical protein
MARAGRAAIDRSAATVVGAVVPGRGKRPLSAAICDVGREIADHYHSQSCEAEGEHSDRGENVRDDYRPAVCSTPRGAVAS